MKTDSISHSNLFLLPNLTIRQRSLSVSLSLDCVVYLSYQWVATSFSTTIQFTDTFIYLFIKIQLKSIQRTKYSLIIYHLVLKRLIEKKNEKNYIMARTSDIRSSTVRLTPYHWLWYEFVFRLNENYQFYRFTVDIDYS